MDEKIITLFNLFVNFGFNVLAVTADKKSVTAWKSAQRQHQTATQQNQQLQALRDGRAYTIALVNGFGGLVALDIDAAHKTTPVSEDFLLQILKKLNIPENYAWCWRSLSGTGWHVWLVVPDLPSETTRKIVFDKQLKAAGFEHIENVRAVEVRAWHNYTVIPPTIFPPLETPVEVSWDALCKAFGIKETLHSVPSDTRTTRNKNNQAYEIAYARAALRYEAENVANAEEGTRNNTLNTAVYKLGRFITEGLLSEEEVISTMLSATTLPEREAKATIHSALRAGKQQPCVIPPSFHNQHTNDKKKKEEIPIIETVANELINEGYMFYLNAETGEYLIKHKDSPVRRVEDNDLLLFKGWAKDRKYPINSPELALVRIANRNIIYPIRDGLNALEWDGQPNIARVAACLKVADGLPQQIAEKWLTYWLLKAVGRVFAQEQNIVFVLEGGQGIGKSHFVLWLGSVLPGCFLEENVDPHSKDCLLNLTKHLVWEISELDAVTRKHDAAALKHFITRSTVTVRPPYGRSTITRPVLASLIATINSSGNGYLTDETGNRRYLILPVANIDWEYTKIDPRQVWAEAVHRWKNGERGYLSTEDSVIRERIASDRQAAGMVDVWLQRYLVVTNNENDILTSADILEFLNNKGLSLGGNEKSQATAIGLAMHRLGVSKGRRVLANGTRLRVWVGIRLNESQLPIPPVSPNNNDDPPDNPSPSSPTNPLLDGGSGGESITVKPEAIQEATTMETHMLENAEEVAIALSDIMAQPAVGLDIETTGLDPLEHKIRLVQIATPDCVYMLDAFRTDVRLLKPLFDAEQGPVIAGHNLKFDLAFLRRAGIDAPKGERLFDTILAAKLLSAGEENPRHGLDAVVYRYLNETLSKALQLSNWSVELTPAQLEYAARDAHIVLPLREALLRELDVAKLTTVAAIENRALPAIVWMEDHGVLINQTEWKKHADKIAAEILEIEKELLNAAGKSINWRSTQQLLKLLRERGHAIKDTNDDTLKPLAAVDTVIKLLLQHREASKRYSAFGHEFLEYVRPDGRIHPDYDQLGAVSGRMTCRKPNLQQIPRDKIYRSCFIAPEGRVLIIADYSQIELRIAADITRDIRMLDAYQRHDDLHTLTARLVLGKREVTKEDRQAAKALNFGLIYGMGAARLKSYAENSYDVRLTPQEAIQFRNKFFETYRGIQKWHRRQKQGTEETRTLANRRRLNVEKFQEKLNTPVQGTGADGLKAALGLMWETRVLCSSAVPILAVHDEIVVECDEEDAETVKTWVVDCMRQGMEQFVRNVPIEVEATVSRDWSGK